MTPAPQSNRVCDLTGLTSEQIVQVETLAQRLQTTLAALSPPERSTIPSIWTLMAQATTPIALTHSYQPDIALIMNRLATIRLVWYDTELRSVLQCPPFSALTTEHQVKVFGWNMAYVCTFIDAPLALLLYGPNTWMDVYSRCQRSGEPLHFRVIQGDHCRLTVESSQDTTAWRVWLPDTLARGLPGPPGKYRGASAFVTPQDLETYRYYFPTESGLAYTLDQAMILCMCLLQVYGQALLL
jgi:hypothetical protein